MENNELKVTKDDEEFLTIRWEVHKSEIPEHSYVREVDSCFHNRFIEYGPVPDILVAEVIHELRTARREAIKYTVDSLMRGIR